MATQTAAKVLDRNRFEARARVFDVVALALILMMGGAMLYEMYTIAYHRGGQAATEIFSQGQPNVAGIVADDARWAIMLAEAFLAAVGFSWLAYRLFVHGARQAGG